ncbi:hypothetical protein Tco_0643051, partial [Tanacetum coccineum]
VVGKGEGELWEVLERWFELENHGEWQFFFKPNKVMEWVLCVQWLRLAVTGARIGPSKSSQSLSNAHKWAVVND